MPEGRILPLLRAFLEGRTDLRADHLEPPLVERASARGLGPILARVTAAGPRPGAADAEERLVGADLTARLLTGEKLEVLDEILDAAGRAASPVVLLKGIATALRYYPAPHLRTMGDIDLLVRPRHYAALEARLLQLGFVQVSRQPREALANRHHGVPLRHPQREVWIDLHTALHPRQYPLAASPDFAVDALEPHLTTMPVGARTADVMTHELQLVYSAARWAEVFDAQRGVFPILDAALILRRHGDAIDWDRVRALARTTWAAAAVHLMLSFLARTNLAPIPAPILASLARADGHTNQASRALLHGLAEHYVVEGRPFGWLRTAGSVERIWATLLRPRSPARNLVAMPLSMVLDLSDTGALKPSSAIGRVGRFIRRAVGPG